LKEKRDIPPPAYSHRSKIEKILPCLFPYNEMEFRRKGNKDNVRGNRGIDPVVEELRMRLLIQ
jgi:hypothetical protein